MRPVPPPHHPAKLAELIVRQLAALRLPRTMRAAERVAALRVRHRLDLWQPGDPLPRGTQALWLRLRGIEAPGAMPGLCAALRGKRCCPPHAAYAPDGWAEYLEEEAAKAAKDAQ